MRLSRSEQRALSQALEGVPGPVFLFGSRLDDDRRGGDIDVIVMAPGQPPQDRFMLSIRIAARFRSQCDEKIDVHVLDPTALSRTERAWLATVDMQPLVTENLAGTSADTPRAQLEHEATQARATDPPWMKGFGDLANLGAETARIHDLIEDEFESIKPEQET